MNREKLHTWNEYVEKINAERAKKYTVNRNLLKEKVVFKSLDDIKKRLYDSQFRIDLEGYRFECFFKKSTGGETTVCIS